MIIQGIISLRVHVYIYYTHHKYLDKEKNNYMYIYNVKYIDTFNIGHPLES